MSILVNTDFTGRWQIPINGLNTAEIDSIITESEEEYLIALLGDDLYYNFITGLAEATPLQKWTFLRDGGYYKVESSLDDNFTNVKFWGVKEMLKYLTWCSIMIKSRNPITIPGMMKPETENGTITDNQEFTADIMSMYNKGIDIYNQAILYIMEMNFGTDIVSVSGADVTLNYVKMFEGGEVITIGSTDYTVDEVSGNVLTLTVAPGNATFLEYIFYRNFIHTNQRKMTNV